MLRRIFNGRVEEFEIGRVGPVLRYRDGGSDFWGTIVAGAGGSSFVQAPIDRRLLGRHGGGGERVGFGRHSVSSGPISSESCDPRSLGVVSEGGGEQMTVTIVGEIDFAR